MRDLFRDTNDSFEAWLKTLTPTEDVAFDRGFEAGLLSVVDGIVATKNTILTALMGIENQDTAAKILLGEVALLDRMESELNKRINILDAKVSLEPPS